MKRLTLIRHARSPWGGPYPDFERPLDEQGRRDAREIGKRLTTRDFHPDLVMTSSAKRAHATAKLIAMEISYPLDRIMARSSIYEANLAGLILVVRGIDKGVEHAVLIGHNPGLHELSHYLTNQKLAGLPPGGLVNIDFQVDAWHKVSENEGRLVSFDHP